MCTGNKITTNSRQLVFFAPATVALLNEMFIIILNDLMMMMMIIIIIWCWQQDWKEGHSMGELVCAACIPHPCHQQCNVPLSLSICIALNCIKAATAMQCFTFYLHCIESHWNSNAMLHFCFLFALHWIALQQQQCNVSLTICIALHLHSLSRKLSRKGISQVQCNVSILIAILFSHLKFKFKLFALALNGQLRQSGIYHQTWW